jgi:hypothetical protein
MDSAFWTRSDNRSHKVSINPHGSPRVNAYWKTSFPNSISERLFPNYISERLTLEDMAPSTSLVETDSDVRAMNGFVVQGVANLARSQRDGVEMGSAARSTLYIALAA